nr:hypothetical protein [Pseudomonas sp. BIGb0427]
MNAPVDPSEVFQVSAQQASILDAQQARGTVLGAQLIMTFDAPIDRQRLEQAAIDLSERHEILRTEYRNMPGMKRPVQVIHAQPRLCLLSVAPGTFEQAGPACLAQLASHSLVLGLGSGEDAHRLRVAAPLASLDEVALGLLEAQLRALYQGQSLAPSTGCNTPTTPIGRLALRRRTSAARGRVLAQSVPRHAGRLASAL